MKNRKYGTLPTVIGYKVYNDIKRSCTLPAAYINALRLLTDGVTAIDFGCSTIF